MPIAQIWARGYAPGNNGTTPPTYLVINTGATRNNSLPVPAVSVVTNSCNTTATYPFCLYTFNGNPYGSIGNGIGWNSAPQLYYVLVDTYDYLDGSCISSAIYGTPGIYSSLEACQIANPQPDPNAPQPCDGICISYEEAAQIDGLISSIQGRLT